MPKETRPVSADTRAQLRSEVMDASLDYVVAYANLGRYLAVVDVEQEEMSDQAVVMFNSRSIFAYDAKKVAGQPQSRFERVGSVFDVHAGKEFLFNERVLKRGDSKWIQQGGSTTMNVTDMKEDEYSDINVFDPLVLPIDYYTTLTVQSSVRNVVNIMMPTGKLFDCTKREDGKIVGRWWHGSPKRIGFTQVVFDKENGNVPCEFYIYAVKPGIAELDKERWEEDTVLYQMTKSKWIRTKASIRLPHLVETRRTTGKQVTWRASINWWLNDDIPDSVLTLSDFQKSERGGSKVQELIDRRRQAMKARSATEEGKSTGERGQ
ncbi:MAG: hypothetical protein AAFP90_15955 [Planctomycetota bacterium]